MPILPVRSTAPVIPFPKSARAALEEIRRANGGKARFHNGPLGRPETPIHRLAGKVQDYLHLPDPAPLYVIFGSIVANSMRGYPVWLMVISPPSGGKTVLLNSLLNLHQVRTVDDLSGKAALLSGVKSKERSKDATGGVLAQLGTRGALIIPDFTTTVLSLDIKEAKTIMGVLRRIYDGAWGRDIGTEGGLSLSWTGRIALIAGSTDAIDDHPAISHEMGERCVYYRYPRTDGWSEANRALGNADPDRVREGIAMAVLEFAAEIDFDWDDPEPPRDLTGKECERLIALAQFAAAGRGSVKREWYRREIELVKEPEVPVRIVMQLAQLIRGMERIGVTPDERWSVVCKIAFDCCSQQRVTALQAIAFDGLHSTSEIAGRLRVSTSSAARVLGDLGAQGMVVRVNEGAWRVSDWAVERLRVGFRVGVVK